jgi:hypothetical protein
MDDHSLVATIGSMTIYKHKNKNSKKKSSVFWNNVLIGEILDLDFESSTGEKPFKSITLGYNSGTEEEQFALADEMLREGWVVSLVNTTKQFKITDDMGNELGITRIEDMFDEDRG